MYGYGGFGYIANPQPDEKESIIVTAAKQNHLRAIEQVLGKEADAKKRQAGLTQWRAALDRSRLQNERIHQGIRMV